jgi:hypothetical protein
VDITQKFPAAIGVANGFMFSGTCSDTSAYESMLVKYFLRNRIKLVKINLYESQFSRKFGSLDKKKILPDQTRSDHICKD